jgi:hypothetical protein
VEAVRVERVIPPGRFAVARYRPVPEGVSCQVVRAGDDEVSEVLLRGLDSPLRPGCFEVEAGPPFRDRGPLRWQLTRRGAVFDLEASAGGVTARGMGMTDPECDEALLVSWTSDDAGPGGIVKYVVRDDHAIDATFTSVINKAAGLDDVLAGRATGDTSGGFPGSYSISYDAHDGSVSGPFDWRIAQRGQVFDMNWLAGGSLALAGFGFADPEGRRSLIATYWAAPRQ